jgi:hypothetical protein
MRKQTVFLLAAGLLSVLVATARAEYAWNGSEWVWKEKEVTAFKRYGCFSNELRPVRKTFWFFPEKKTREWSRLF